MKVVNCSKCNKLVLEIEKGRIARGATFYCKECSDEAARKDFADQLRNIQGGSNPFGGIFGGV